MQVSRGEILRLQYWHFCWELQLRPSIDTCPRRRSYPTLCHNRRRYPVKSLQLVGCSQQDVKKSHCSSDPSIRVLATPSLLVV